MEVVEKYMKGIKFTLFSPEEVRKMSVVKLIVPDTYNDDGYPIDGGLADSRMGVIDPGLRCKTCGGSVRTCPGHWGRIELIRPVVHPEFAPMIFALLKATCKKCRKILLSKEEMDVIRESKEDVAKQIFSKVKKVLTCPYCGEEQIEIKFEKPTSFYEKERILLPTEVRDELAKISDEDLRLLGLDPESSRLEWTVLTVLLVPPVGVRPSITLETGERSEDDLTHKLVDIMRINQRLEANIAGGAPQLIIEDLWELLQYHITTYFNNECANIPPARHRSGRPLKTLAQRLKGKEGRFRFNLSGKRVNFCARTVVSPDGVLSISQVGVPDYVANELTVPIHVTDWNVEECRQLVLKTDYPSAVYITAPDGKRRKITEANRAESAAELTTGWIVERQLKDGDVVLFNRHPSLHRMSIMAHEVKVLPGLSFRLAPAVTIPYNADFDGDEMNVHVPQREEARVEAAMLMKTQDQIISPRHGHAIIKPTEDHVSGIYILTKEGTCFTKEEVSNLLAACGIYELPKPDCGKLYSGKLLFSQLLPKDFNYTTRTKLCNCGENCKKEKCSNEGYVVIKNGKLVCGALEAKTFGSDLIDRLTVYGNEFVRDFIDRSTKLATFAITTRGFTISLDHYSLSNETRKRLIDASGKAEKEVNALVMQFENKSLERAPGRTLRETLEEEIMVVLSKVRELSGKLAKTELGVGNPAILMAEIGARGNIINVQHMCGVISQQSVREKRLRRGFRGRVLSFFKRGDIGAKARGYVTSNFLYGLNPIEFFFHCMGGREGMVNTAIRTARSGYMQRRFINALQDLVVSEDLTVRDANGKIIEFLYGGDGLDPMRVVKIGEAIAVPIAVPERE